MALFNTPQASPSAPAVKPPPQRIGPVGPAPAPPPVKSPGIVQGVLNAASNFLNPNKVSPLAAAGQDAASLGVGILRSPGQLVGGAIDTASDVGKFMGDNINADYIRSTPILAAVKGVGDAATAYKAFHNRMQPWAGGASLADTMSARQQLGSMGGNPQVNQLGAEGGAAAIPAVGEGSILTQAAKAAVGGALGFSNDPNHPLVSRLLNGAGAAAFDLAGAAVVRGVPAAYRAVANKVTAATPQEAVADGLERTFTTQRTAEANATAQGLEGAPEPEPSAVLDKGERHTDALAPEAATGAQPPTETVVKDANALLDKAGVAERLPEDGTHEVTPDGRLVVAPSTKADLDGQGAGRAFAADNESPDPTEIFKETDPQGGSRVVGKIPTDDLNGLVADATHLHENGESPNLSTPSQAGSAPKWEMPVLNTTYDLGAFVKGISDKIPTEAHVLTDGEWRAAAAENGMAIPDVHRLANAAAEDSSGQARAVSVYRAMHRQAEAEVDALDQDRYEDEWSTKPLEHPDWDQGLKAVHNQSVIANFVRELKANAGRQLRAWGIALNGDTVKKFAVAPGDEIPPQAIPDFDTYRASFGKTAPEDLDPIPPGSAPVLPRNPIEFQQWLDRRNAAKALGPDVLQKFYQGQQIAPNAWNYLRNSLANWEVASMVSRPRTYERDLMGPSSIGFIQSMEEMGGTITQAMIKSFQGDLEGAGDSLADAANAPLAYLRTFTDMGTSLQRMVQVTARGGRSILGGEDPYHISASSIPQAAIDSMVQQGQPRLPYILGNAINYVPNAIHALHGGVNELALRQSYLGSVRAQAMLDAHANGLNGSDFWDAVAGAVNSAEDPLTGAATNPDALAVARGTTMTKPVTDAASQPVMSAVDNAIKQLRNIPEFRATVLPIYNIPANQLGKTLQRIPLLGATFRTSAAELSGALGPQRQAQAMGRQITGATVLGMGLMMAESGTLTGAGPSAPADRAAWMLQGNQPFSVRVGGHWVSYAKLDIIGPLLGTIGGVHDVLAYHRPDEPSSNLALAAVSSMAEYFRDRSNLQGAANFFTIGDRDNPTLGLSNIGDQVASNLVPGVVQQLGVETTDPFKRTVRNPLDAIKAMIPGLSKELDPQRNIFGEPVNRQSYLGLNPALSLPIGLAKANTYQADPETDEIYRHFTKTNWAPGVMSPALPGAGADMRDIPVEDGHSMYNHVASKLQTVTNQDGQTLREAVRTLITSPEYLDQMVDGKDPSARKAEDIDGQQKLTRGAALETIFQQFHTLAKQAAAQDSPITARYLAATALKRDHNAVLGGTSIHDIAGPKGDGLAQSLGVDMGQLVQTVQGVRQ